MSASPRVSIVIGAYNAQRYLAQTLDSLLAQTLRDFELIVVDDGSNDGSLSVLREYEANDARVRIISRPNTGIVGALNDGLAAAKGQFIARMDADDISMPDRFEKQTAFLSEHPECVLVGSQVLLMDPEGATLSPKWDTEYTHEGIDQAHLKGRWPLVHPTIMVRRDAFKRIGGYRSEYQFLEDLDLFLRLAAKLASLPDPLLHYRLHPGSICHTREKDQDLLRPELEAEAYKRRGIPTPNPETHSRETRSLDAPGERFKLWAWWALKSGNVGTARKYAARAFRSAPHRIENWRLMYCALRGR